MYTPTKPIVALFADIITKPEDKRVIMDQVLTILTH